MKHTIALLHVIILAFVAPLMSQTIAVAEENPLPGGHDGHVPGGELKQGRYVGYLKMDNQTAQIAASLDFFLVQVEDAPEGPRLDAILKLSLGGYASTEYVTEVYENLRYDFNNGTLSLDETNGDLVVSAEVHNQGGTHIVGKVLARSAASSGVLELRFLTDEPPDEPEELTALPMTVASASPFMLGLRGQYEGRCGTKRAVMQIQTGKGLLERSAPQEVGLHGYGIVGTIGYDDPQCRGDNSSSRWCNVHSYSSGYFNYLNGKLVLRDANSATECKRGDGDSLDCRVRVLGQSVDCALKRADVTQPPAFKNFPRRFRINVPADKRQPLPLPLPPSHTELVNTLNGTFYGYIHNETNDQYQRIYLNVIASVSTDNLHNENRVYVVSTGVSFFGRDNQESFFTHQFDRRRFYVRPGFVLEGENADAFLQVEEWWNGSINGVWYSHDFGRVGTVQLVKGNGFPTLPEQAKVAPLAIGEFESEPRGNVPQWWFKAFMPTQPVSREQSFVSFEGETELLGGLGLRGRISTGSYDFYAGGVAWLAEYPNSEGLRMTSGLLHEDGHYSLFWPGKPEFGVPMSDFKYLKFHRAAKLPAEGLR